MTACHSHKLHDAIDDIYHELNSLLRHGQCFSEYELLTVLRKKQYFVESPTDSTEALFQQHFILMHVLYTLRQDFIRSRLGHLSISALNIRLLPLADSNGHDLSAIDHGSEKLADYYLDVDAFFKENEASIHAMLNQFWQRYASYSQSLDNVDGMNKAKALNLLGMSELKDKNDLKYHFRLKASNVHPDKGGEHEAFIEIKQAYYLLKAQL